MVLPRPSGRCSLPDRLGPLALRHGCDIPGPTKSNGVCDLACPREADPRFGDVLDEKSIVRSSHTRDAHNCSPVEIDLDVLADNIGEGKPLSADEIGGSRSAKMPGEGPPTLDSASMGGSLSK